MARMHTRKRGKSGSIRIESKQRPSWIQYSDDEIKEMIIKMRKQGMTKSMIGIKLRDQYAIPGTRPVLHMKLGQVLKDNNLESDVPEDLQALIERYKRAMKHLSLNKHDMNNKRKAQLIMSKMLRLIRYYKRTSRLPQDWSLERVLQ